MSKNRFDLEQEIMACWQIVDDLKLVYQTESLYIDEDEMQNVLLGLTSLYKIKFETLFNTYEECLKSGGL